jgi:integrase/recombinase XerD
VFDFAWWTGERMGAIVQLSVNDVYASPERQEPREYVVFPASFRKDKKTREVLIHPNLALQLRMFKPSEHGFLFQPMRHPQQHLSVRDVDWAMRFNLLKLGWEQRGFSTHSFRRSFITRLHERGTDPVLMQQLTGHSSLSNLMRYVETDPKRVNQALLSL